MDRIKIQCPAKINLTLEIINKRDDGFHNIKSIMQLINLYDYITITKSHTDRVIRLTGTNREIPYNENNLIYKAAELFFQKTGITTGIDIFLEKNIPIAAGLAGGSTDAAGTIYGLNKLFNLNLSQKELGELCSHLGSDLNVCLQGGCLLATSRGEVTQPLKVTQSHVTLIKPKTLGISAKEAYQKYANKELKPKYNMTEKMVKSIESQEDIKPFLYNDLEYAVFDDYPQLQKIKKAYPQAVMSGSGSTYFILQNADKSKLGDDYEFINNLQFISDGVKEYDSKNI